MPNAAEIFVDTPVAWDAEVMFGLPGDGINGIMEMACASIERADEVERVLDEALMPPKMPPDYAKNFRKAPPETPGRERIEENVAREPARTMMEAEG
ncbi:hypothetical protein CK215_16980 [Mesorhizobium sp. WSM3864]|uniref:hypothetical protein n=1 Tax=Mesorhizobium sp. WSM3864 TaxID=2029404 RepID=UPI000BAFA388|nr:hypothetical protein [Mesorhizobium sp. WSM3864]PBB91400.1 hypothetical protein CK215_16980 [Mesorhizobium sp. WSM3864]